MSFGRGAVENDFRTTPRTRFTKATESGELIAQAVGLNAEKR